MTSPSSTDSSPSNKRKQRTTALLSNRPDQDDYEYETSTTLGTDGENEAGVSTQRMMTDSGNVESAIPLSNMRTTSRGGVTSAAIKVDMDDDAGFGGVDRRPRKAVKTESAQEAVEAVPTTPKKGAARTNAVAGSSNVKTPPKKQAVSVPTTPRSGEPASSWTPAHWDDLNFAILKVAHDHASELYDASPNLGPWRVKGRLLVKLRQLMKDASGGDVASKRWDVELKPARGRNSPKKQGPST